MRRRPVHVLALFMLAALLTGCGGNTIAGVQAQRESSRYRLELTLETTAPGGQPGQPVEVLAEVANTGSRVVYTGWDCYLPRPQVEIYGPDDRLVHLSDPRVVPLCIWTLGEFGPGARGAAYFEFTGELFTVNGESYAAPAGTYVVIARFRYARDTSSGLPESVERTASFYWSGP